MEQNEDWEITLGALADRFIELTDGLCIPSGAAKEQNGLWDKLTALADVIPMTSMFSNYDGLAALNADFFDKALDGDMGDFLSHFEVKEDAVAGGVPVTFALINASDYIVDRFFPDTVRAELYADYDPMTDVQEYFTGGETDPDAASGDNGDNGDNGESGGMNFFRKIADFFRRIIYWFRNLFSRG